MPLETRKQPELNSQKKEELDQLWDTQVMNPYGNAFNAIIENPEQAKNRRHTLQMYIEVGRRYLRRAKESGATDEYLQETLKVLQDDVVEFNEKFCKKLKKSYTLTVIDGYTITEIKETPLHASSTLKMAAALNPSDKELTTKHFHRDNATLNSAQKADSTHGTSYTEVMPDLMETMGTIRPQKSLDGLSDLDMDALDEYWSKPAELK